MNKPTASAPTAFSTTDIIHPAYHAPTRFAAIPVGLHRASTVLFESLADLRARRWDSPDDYVYGLRGTPTTYQLAQQLAAIEGGRFCTLAPSGLSAITLAMMSLLQAGDEVLIQESCYGPALEFAEQVLKPLGIGVQSFDAMAPQELQAKLSRRTKLVWLEAASSITMEVPDVPELARLAHEHTQGAAVVGMDVTWGGGVACRVFDLGVDVSMQALTKFQSGGADVLMGSLVTQREDLHMRIKQMHMRLGLGVSVDDCALVLRSLPTLKLRFDAHDRAARALASWCAEQPQVARVLHPALPSCPGHAFWQRDFSGAAGIFSIILDRRYSQTQVDAFVDGLRLFKIGYSWGGPMSLAVTYQMSQIRRQWPRIEWLDAARCGALVRLCVGLEDVEDLRQDLQQALARALPL